MGKITFIKPGLFTSIQDTGRFGYRKYGVPLSGAMDLQSAQLANLLVNNESDAPVLEITLSGPEIRFSQNALIAISGADLSPLLDQNSVKMNSAIRIDVGQILSFGKPTYGVRAYLAVAGGFDTEKILGSRSQYYPVTTTSNQKKGDELAYNPYTGPIPNTALKPDMGLFNNEWLEVLPGPEYSTLCAPMQHLLTKTAFRIGENNRMGYQLQSEKMPENTHSIITAPVVPGTVQLLPSGKLIVLMRDGQVTGGYPRILQLTSQSINRLSQKKTEQLIRFKWK